MDEATQGALQAFARRVRQASGAGTPGMYGVRVEQAGDELWKLRDRGSITGGNARNAYEWLMVRTRISAAEADYIVDVVTRQVT